MITPKIPLCHSDSCECGVTYTSGSALQQLCVGTVTSPCSCSLTTPISETFRCEVRGSEHVPWRDGGDGGVMGGEVQKDRLNTSSPTPSLSIPPPPPPRVQCNSPHYTGRSGGSPCTLDSDQDGFPDVPLECSVEEEGATYCITDSCPTIYNSGNDPLACSGTGDGMYRLMLGFEGV